MAIIGLLRERRLEGTFLIEAGQLSIACASRPAQSFPHTARASLIR